MVADREVFTPNPPLIVVRGPARRRWLRGLCAALPLTTVRPARPQRPEPSLFTHLLFVGHELSSRLPTWVAACGQRPVVVVAEAAGGLEKGAALNFVAVGDRLRFEASPGAAERVGIRLSARLLGVAERVLKERRS